MQTGDYCLRSVLLLGPANRLLGLFRSEEGNGPPVCGRNILHASILPTLLVRVSLQSVLIDDGEKYGV